MNLPIACSLEGDTFRSRTDDWAHVLVGVAGRNAIPGGIELRFEDTGHREQLQELVDREAECCPWMSMLIAESGRGLSLSISSDDPMGERQINEWFGSATSRQ